MTLREMLERRTAIAGEMRQVNESAADGALAPEAQARWDALRTDLDQLEARIDRQAALDDLDRRAAGQPLGGNRADRNFERECQEFSVLRALAAQLPGSTVDAGRERELSTEIARRAGRSFEGIAVPMAIFQRPAEQRVFTTANPVAGPGSNLIATQLDAGQYIDLLRANMAVRSRGARVLAGLVGNLAIPRLKADATAAWAAENNAISASDPQTDQVSLTPKHAGAIVEFSRNMLLQSSADVEQLLRADLAMVLAQALDQAAISGLGSSNQPRGILNTSGIGSVAMGTNGAAITTDAVADLIGQVADVNAEMGALGFLTNTKVRRSASKLKDTTNRPLGLDTVFQSLPRTFSNNVPSNLTKGTSSGVCSALIYGNWSDLLIGLWSELDILVNPYESTAYSKGNVQIRAMMTVDISVRHPQSFAAIQDILA